MIVISPSRDEQSAMEVMFLELWRELLESEGIFYIVELNEHGMLNLRTLTKTAFPQKEYER